jgi:hypothetical protein
MGGGGSSSSGMRVEEKIARAYHRDLSWRKVLVRLEPDAHNNMIVRRIFANAYGWPVVRHLCDAHFGDGALMAAETAAAARQTVALGNHVASLDELMDRALEAARPATSPSGKSGPAAPLLQKVDAVPERDAAYLDDSSDDEDDDDHEDGELRSGLRARLPRLWSPAPKSAASKSSSPGKSPSPSKPAASEAVSRAETSPAASAPGTVAATATSPDTVVVRGLTESPGVMSDEDRLASALASMQAARAAEEVD